MTATAEAQTLNFTFPTCDCLLTVKAVDKSGVTLTQINGSIDAKPSDLKAGEYYYNLWGQLSGGSGTIKVQTDRKYLVNTWFWDNTYLSSGEIAATCTKASASVSVPAVSIITGAVKGKYVDSLDATSVTLDNTAYINVYATRDGNYRSCTANKSEYSCDLSEGEWQLGYWIDSQSGYASAPSGTTSNKVTVTSKGSTSFNLTLLRTGSIKVSVKDPDGNALSNVWVDAAPYSIEDQGKNKNQMAYGIYGCSTPASGTCTVKVGAASAGTVYYLRAHLPYNVKLDEGLQEPPETAVTVKANETSSVALAYTVPDAESTITVTVKGTSDLVLANNATVSCFSNEAASVEVHADTSGKATCPCTTEDTWYAIAQNIVTDTLYSSATTKISCSQTITDAATQTVNLKLSDGFEVNFPQGCLGDANDQVTVTVTPVVTTATGPDVPLEHGYSVTAVNSDTNESITQLKTPAVFTIPYDADKAAAVGVSEQELSVKYFDTSAGTYKDIPAAVDSDANTLAFEVDHLTDFAIVTNANLSNIQGKQTAAEAEVAQTTGDTTTALTIENSNNDAGEAGDTSTESDTITDSGTTDSGTDDGGTGETGGTDGTGETDGTETGGTEDTGGSSGLASAGGCSLVLF
jgi:hypothetical protein